MLTESNGGLVLVTAVILEVLLFSRLRGPEWSLIPEVQGHPALLSLATLFSRCGHTLL